MIITRSEFKCLLHKKGSPGYVPGLPRAQELFLPSPMMTLPVIPFIVNRLHPGLFQDLLG